RDRVHSGVFQPGGFWSCLQAVARDVAHRVQSSSREGLAGVRTRGPPGIECCLRRILKHAPGERGVGQAQRLLETRSSLELGGFQTGDVWAWGVLALRAAGAPRLMKSAPAREVMRRY